MPYRLEPGELLPEGMRRLMLEQVTQITENLTHPEVDRETGIHNARKRCKRLRAAYRLLRGEIGAPRYRQENIRFREISRSLAGARDAWVRVQTLDALVGAQRIRDAGESPFAAFRQALLDAYQRQLANPAYSLDAVLAEVDAARRAVEILPIERETFAALRPGLRRTYRRGRRAMAQACATGDLDLFHEWRKRVKYLWHQIQILENCWPAAFSGLAKELHALSDLLGDAHDLEVLHLTALEMPAAFASEDHRSALLEQIAEKRRQLESRACALGERLYREPPRVFTHKVALCCSEVV